MRDGGVGGVGGEEGGSKESWPPLGFGSAYGSDHVCPPYCAMKMGEWSVGVGCTHGREIISDHVYSTLCQMWTRPDRVSLLTVLTFTFLTFTWRKVAVRQRHAECIVFAHSQTPHGVRVG